MESQDNIGGTGDLDKFLSKHDDRAQKWLKVIEDMMGDYDNYGYAQDTLIGIYDYVLANNSISDKQIQAVENIRDSIHKRRW